MLESLLVDLLLNESSKQLRSAEKAAFFGPKNAEVYKEKSLQKVIIAGTEPSIDAWLADLLPTECYK